MNNPYKRTIKWTTYGVNYTVITTDIVAESKPCVSASTPVFIKFQLRLWLQLQLETVNIAFSIEKSNKF